MEEESSGGSSNLETSKADRSVWLMKCPVAVAKSWQNHPPSQPLSKVLFSIDPLLPEDDPSHLQSMRDKMEENNSDDEEINPFTSLLTEQHNKPNPLTTINHELLQNHFLHSIRSTVIIRQLPSEGISFQLWPAATSFVSLLDTHRINPTTSPLSTVFPPRTTPLKILELGSGTGIVGIVAAATLGSIVTLTDLPNVVPNLKFNAEANAGVVGSSGGAVTVAALRWGHAADVEMIGDEFDVVLASDVVYHDHLYDPLIETLRLILLGEKNKNKKKEIVFVMAHMKRWKKESVFFKKARKFFLIDVLNVDTPCNGSRVGVVVYRFVGKNVTSIIN